MAMAWLRLSADLAESAGLSWQRDSSQELYGAGGGKLTHSVLNEHGAH